jgi:hypothetical protein
MKTVAFWGLLSLSAVALGWAADREVVEKEVAKLQADLTNLQADLQAGGGELDLPATLGEGIQSVREEVIYLKVRMRKHRDAGGEGVGVPLDEIKALRLDIADLRNDLRDHLGPREVARERDLTLPAGTEISVRLETSLSSASAQPGDRFSASTAEPIARSGVVVVDAGSRSRGVSSWWTGPKAVPTARPDWCSPSTG